MDRITASLLDEFCKEHELLSLPEDKRFEHFTSYLAMSRFPAESFSTHDLVVGSGGDTAIDGIGIIANGALISDPDDIEELANKNGYLDVSFVFVQAERSGSFDSSKIGQIGFGVKDFFNESPTLPRNQFIQAAAEIMSEVYKRSGAFRHGNPVCRVYYMTTGKWVGDKQLEARRAGVVDDLTATGLFRSIDFVPVGAEDIQKLYRATKNAITREFNFGLKVVVPEIPGVSEAYLGLLPVPDFLKIIRDEGSKTLLPSIFYDNVRDWQDYNVVNKGIGETIGSPSLRRQFALMNNGITIIAKSMRVTANKFVIEDFQVVNGCQTSHVLHDYGDNVDSAVMIPVRVIATQDEGVINSIIKATNSQTPVKAEQLLALSDFQKRIETFFESFTNGKKLYYERRSRQFSSASQIEKTRVVTLGNLIRAFASMFLDEPHRTAKNFTSLLDNVGRTIFADNHQLEPYYVAAFMYYKLEFFFRNQFLDAKYKPARYHILLAARLLGAGKKPMPAMGSNEMRRYSESLMDILWKQDGAEMLFARAALAVDTVANGNFNREHIRTLPTTEALKKHCATMIGE